MKKTSLTILTALGLSFAVQGSALAQHTHAPGQHPAETVAHDEHVDRVHEAYLGYEEAVETLCIAIIEAFAHHTADHYDDDPIHDHDQSFFIADCIVQHHAAHNEAASDLHSAVHNEHH